MLPRPARPARREGRATLRPGEARTVDGPCVGQRHVLGVDGQVARQLVAAQRLYAPQCGAVDGAAMAEVKAQPLRLDDGPLLVYVVSEHLHARGLGSHSSGFPYMRILSCVDMRQGLTDRLHTANRWEEQSSLHACHVSVHMLGSLQTRNQMRSLEDAECRALPLVHVHSKEQHLSECKV